MSPLLDRLRPGSSEPVPAAYARVLDGAHLWLAVPGAGPLTLRGEAAEVPVGTDVEGDLVTAVVALDDLDAPGPWRVVHGSGRAEVAVLAPPPPGDDLPTRDPGPWEVVALDGALAVVRRDRAGVEVTALDATDAGVRVAIALPAGEVTVAVKQRVVATLPVTDGGCELGALAGLAPGETATLRVGALPVVRRRQVLARPNAAVALPPLAEPDLDLRWLKDGRLAVVRQEPDR